MFLELRTLNGFNLAGLCPGRGCLLHTGKGLSLPHLPPKSLTTLVLCPAKTLV